MQENKATRAYAHYKIKMQNNKYIKKGLLVRLLQISSNLATLDCVWLRWKSFEPSRLLRMQEKVHRTWIPFTCCSKAATGTMWEGGRRWLGHSTLPTLSPVSRFQGVWWDVTRLAKCFGAKQKSSTSKENFDSHRQLLNEDLTNFPTLKISSVHATVTGRKQRTSTNNFSILHPLRKTEKEKKKNRNISKTAATQSFFTAEIWNPNNPTKISTPKLTRRGV